MIGTKETLRNTILADLDESVEMVMVVEQVEVSQGFLHIGKKKDSRKYYGLV